MVQQGGGQATRAGAEDQTPWDSSQHACKMLELSQRGTGGQAAGSAGNQRSSSGTPAGPYLTTSLRKAVVK